MPYGRTSCLCMFDISHCGQLAAPIVRFRPQCRYRISPLPSVEFVERAAPWYIIIPRRLRRCCTVYVPQTAEPRLVQTTFPIGVWSTSVWAGKIVESSRGRINLAQPLRAGSYRTILELEFDAYITVATPQTQQVRP
jgi:hypothetical protein